MKFKNHIALIVALHLSFSLQAQFYAGSSFMAKANTPITIDSVTMLPSSDLNLSGNELVLSRTPETNTIPPGASISRVAVFTIPFSYQGTLGMYYDHAELNGNVAAQLNLVYHTGQSGYNTTNLFTTSNNANHVVATTGLQTITISKLTATNMTTVLPLQLLSFQADKKNDQVVIRWETANEKGVSYYDVEKSDNGKEFAFLARQHGGKASYAVFDEQPFSGWNYYRLNIVEQVNGSHYSHIAGVYFDGYESAIVVYPNPVTEQLNMHLHSKGVRPMTYSITGVDGRVVKKGNLVLHPGDNQFAIDFSSLSVGIYLLKTSDGFTSKIVKE